MARKKIKPINLDATVKDILNKYGDEVYDVLGDAVNETAEEATQKLKAVNSFAPGGNPSGAYSGSWLNEKVAAGRLGVKQVVRNEEHYRLTHLLEKGHVIRNGTGRTFGRVPAYPHIAPVNDWANDEVVRSVERKIKGI